MTALDDIPPPAREHLREALALDDWSAAQRPLTAALHAVHWPERPAPVPDATELTKAQRAVAELLTTRPGTWTAHTFALPQANWNRRCWLGLDPPSVLERPHTHDGETAPLWRLALAREREPDAMSRLLQTVPLPGRLQALRDLSFHAYGCRLQSAGAVTAALLEAGLGEDVASWAPALADGYLDRLVAHAGIRSLTPDLCFPCFLPLARAGVPIEPRWEPWCAIAAGSSWEPWSHECLLALAPDRRDEVLARLFDRALDDEERLHWARIALHVHRSRWLVETVLAGARFHRRMTEAEVLRDTAAAVRGDRELLARVTTALESLPPPTLEIRRVIRPGSRREVAEPLQPLLAIAAREAFGPSTSPDALFDADAALTLVTLVEPRTTRGYTALLHHVDTGVVFRSGSSDVVARRIQGAFEGPDAALTAALTETLRTLPAPTQG